MGQSWVSGTGVGARRMRTGRVRPARERGFFSRVRFSYACALGAGALHAGFVNGEAGGQFRNLLADALLDFGVADVGEDFGDPGGDLLHFRFAHAARSHGGAAEADAATLHGGQGIEGNGIFVYSDARAVEGLFGISAGDAAGVNFDQEQMIVSAAGDDAETAFRDGGSHSL